MSPLRRILGLLLLVLCASIAISQPARKAGEKYALLVGVRQYDPNELRTLKFAEADVDGLAQVLRQSGYQSENVVLMTQSVGAQNTRFLPLGTNIRKELRLLLQDLNPEDSVLVAFAGHGVKFKTGEESYFCPQDARLNEKPTLIPLTEVYKELEKCKAGLRLLLVDACRNDPLSRNSRTASESITRPQIKPPPGGIAAFFSCSENEEAFEHDDLKHGVFFNFVIEGLKGAAKNEDQNVTLPDLQGFVTRRVSTFVRDKYGTRQMPEMKNESRGLVPIVSLAQVPNSDAVKRAVASGEITNSIGMKLVPIPAGKFQMGSPSGDDQAYDDEKPQHEVEIRNAFHLGKYEVSRGQFRRFVEDTTYKTEAEKASEERTWRNPGYFQQTDEHPVVYVTWKDAKAFCKWLSDKEGKQYGLPTEAQWEYSCRAKTTTRFHSGDGNDSLKRVARFGLEAANGTAPVGQYQPNAFGLHDMHGNVWEWCEDWSDEKYYQNSPAQDPQGPSAGSLRVIRGGSVNCSPCRCRAADRSRYEPAFRFYDVGFRVVLVR
jgi:sulfatase modifying factor 1